MLAGGLEESVSDETGTTLTTYFAGADEIPHCRTGWDEQAAFLGTSPSHLVSLFAHKGVGDFGVVNHEGHTTLTCNVCRIYTTLTIYTLEAFQRFLGSAITKY